MKNWFKNVGSLAALLGALLTVTSASAANRYARLTASVASDSTGMGGVYVSTSGTQSPTTWNTTASAQTSKNVSQTSTTVTLYAYAKANEGYRFDYWSADDAAGTSESTKNPYNKTCTASGTQQSPTPNATYAHFKKLCYVTLDEAAIAAENHLTVSSVKVGNTTLTKDDAGRYVVDAGSTVSVTFAAMSGYEIASGNPMTLNNVQANVAIEASDSRLPAVGLGKVYMTVDATSLRSKGLVVSSVKNKTTGQAVTPSSGKYAFTNQDEAEITFAASEAGATVTGNNPFTVQLTGDLTLDAHVENLPLVAQGSSLANSVLYTSPNGQTFYIGYEGGRTNWVDGELVFVFDDPAVKGTIEMPPESVAHAWVVGIGGGGAGGSQIDLGEGGGGGGAGGFAENTNVVLQAGRYGIEVGAGGVNRGTQEGMSTPLPGEDGVGYSIMTNGVGVAVVSAIYGGGGGASYYSEGKPSIGGQNGGSGGGGAWVHGQATPGGGGVGGNGRDGQGNAGGTPTIFHCGGGGGGAAVLFDENGHRVVDDTGRPIGQGGADGTAGEGRVCTILGSTEPYACGGAGGTATGMEAAANGKTWGSGGSGGNGGPGVGMGGNGANGAIIVRISSMYQIVRVKYPNCTLDFQVPQGKANAKDLYAFDTNSANWAGGDYYKGKVAQISGTNFVKGAYIDGSATNGVGHYTFTLALAEGCVWWDGVDESKTFATPLTCTWRAVANTNAVDATITVKKTVDYDPDGEHATITITSHTTPEINPIVPRVLFLGTFCKSHSLAEYKIVNSLNSLAKKGHVDWYILNKPARDNYNGDDFYKNDLSGHIDHLHQVGYEKVDGVEVSVTYDYEGNKITTSPTLSGSGDNTTVTWKKQDGRTNVLVMNTNNHQALVPFFKTLYERLNSDTKYDYIVLEFDGSRIADDYCGLDYTKNMDGTFDDADKVHYAKYENEQKVAELLEPYYTSRQMIWVVDNGYSSNEAYPYRSTDTVKAYYRPNSYFNNSYNCNLTTNQYEGLVALLNPKEYLECKRDKTRTTVFTESKNYSGEFSTYQKDRSSPVIAVSGNPVMANTPYDIQTHYENATNLYMFLEENVKPIAYKIAFNDNVMTNVGLTITGLDVAMATNKVDITQPNYEKDLQFRDVVSYDGQGEPEVTDYGKSVFDNLSVSFTENSVQATLTNLTYEAFTRLRIGLVDDGTFKTSVNATYNPQTGEWEKDPNNGKAQVGLLDEEGRPTYAHGEAATSVAWSFTAYRVRGSVNPDLTVGELHLNYDPEDVKDFTDNYYDKWYNGGYDPIINYRGKPGYEITKLVYDGVTQVLAEKGGNRLSFMIEKIDKNHEVAVTFEKYVKEDEIEAPACTNYYDAASHLFTVKLWEGHEKYFTATNFWYENGTEADKERLSADEFTRRHGKDGDLTNLANVGEYEINYEVMVYQEGYYKGLPDDPTTPDLENDEPVQVYTNSSKVVVLPKPLHVSVKYEYGDDPLKQFIPADKSFDPAKCTTVCDASQFAPGESESSEFAGQTLTWVCDDFKGLNGTYKITPHKTQRYTSTNYDIIYDPGVLSAGKGCFEIGKVPQSTWLNPETTDTGVPPIDKVYDGVTTSIVVDVTVPLNTDYYTISYLKTPAGTTNYADVVGQTFGPENPVLKDSATNVIWYTVEPTEIAKDAYYAVTNYQWVRISPRPVWLRSAGYTNAYDGVDLFLKPGVREVWVDAKSPYDFVAGEREAFDLDTISHITEVGERPNLFNMELRKGYTGDVKLSNYVFTPFYGILRVDPAKMTVGGVEYPDTTDDWRRPPAGENGVDPVFKVYDGFGTNISVRIDVPNTENYPLDVRYALSEDATEWLSELSLTNVYRGPVYFSIVDPKGNYVAVTNYQFVTISQRVVTVTAPSGTHEYNGKAYRLEGTTKPVETENFVNDEGIASFTATTDSQVTHVAEGEVANKIATLEPRANTLLSNYLIATTNAGTLAITPRPLVLTSGDDFHVFDEKPYTWNGTVTGDNFVDDEDFQYSNFVTKTAVGSYDATFDFADGTAQVADYAVDSAAGKVYGKLIIGEDNIYINDQPWDGEHSYKPGEGGVDPIEMTYNGEGTSVVVNVTHPMNAHVTFSTDNWQTTTDVSPAFTNVGTHTVWYAVDKEGYTSVTNSTWIKINPRTITVKADDLSVRYGTNELPKATYTVDNGVANDDYDVTLAFKTVETPIFEPKPVKTLEDEIITNAPNAIIITSKITGEDASANYEVIFDAGDLTVNKGLITVDQGPDVETTYNNTPTNIAVTVLDPSEGMKIRYSTDGGETWKDADEFGLVDAGEYEVTYEVYDPEGLYETVRGTGNVLINRRPLIVTVVDTQRFKGEEDPDWGDSSTNLLSVTFGDTKTLMSDDLIKSLGLHEKFNFGRTGDEVVDTYNTVRITVKDLNDPLWKNYIPQPVDGRIFITSLGIIKYTLKNYEGTYDAQTHMIELSGLDPAATTVKYALTRDGEYLEKGAFVAANAEVLKNVQGLDGDAGIEVWFTLNAGAGYLNDIPAVGRVWVKPAPVTVTAVSETVNFGEPAVMDVTVEGLVGGEDKSLIKYEKDTDYDPATAQPDDEFDFTVTGVARQGNYTVSYVNGTITVSGEKLVKIGGEGPFGRKDEPMPTPDDPGEDEDKAKTGVRNVTKTYDGESTNVTVVATDEAGTTTLPVKFLNDKGEWVAASDFEGFTNAGTNKVWYLVEASGYAAVSNYAWVVVNPRDATLISGGYSGAYDAKAHSNATVTASGFLAGEGVTTNTWVTITDVGTNANEFTYEVLDGTLASNYRVTCVTNDLVVTKRKFPGDERELYIDATNFTYTAYGQGPQVTNEFITVDGVDFPTNLFDFVENYKTNVNEYVLQIVPKNPENFEGIIEVPWNIAKAPLTVTPKPMALTYLDPKPGQGDYLGWTAATLLGADTEACITGTPVYDTTYAAGSPVGDYDITVTGLDSANYEITFAKGVLTVTDKSIDVPLTNDDYEYDGKKHVGVPAGTGYTVDEASNVATNAGTYTAIVTLEDGYTWKDGTTGPKEVTWKVLKRKVTLQSKGAEKPYDGTPLTVNPDEITDSGSFYVENEKLDYYELASITEVGETDATFLAKSSATADIDNYEITYVTTAKLVITPSRDTFVFVAPSQKWAYDGAAHSNINWTAENDDVIGENTPVAAIDPLCVVTTPDDGIVTNAFLSYQILDKDGQDVTRNYSVTNRVGYLEVTNAVITSDLVTVTPYAGKYDGKPHGIKVEVAPLAGDQEPTVKYALSEDGEFKTGELDFTHVTNQLVWFAVEAKYHDSYTNSAQVVISPLEIAFTSATESKPYDGTALVNKADKITKTGDEYPGDEGFTLTPTGSQTEVGESQATFTWTPVGETRESDYAITPHYGRLIVTGENELVLVANDLNEPFDDTYKSNCTFTAVNRDGILDADDEIEATFDLASKIRDPGTVPNVILSARVLSKGGEEKPGYTFTFLPGTLTVTPLSLEDAVRGVSTNAVYDSTPYQIGVEITKPLLTEATTNYLQSTGVYGAENPQYVDTGDYETFFTVSARGYATLTNSATVKIDRRKVTLLSGSKSDVYREGIELTEHSYDLAEGSLDFVTGHGVDVEYQGKQTEEGSSQNIFTCKLTGDGVKETNYNIEKRYGTLTLTAGEMKDVRVTGFETTYDQNGYSVTVSGTNGYPNCTALFTTNAAVMTSYAAENPSYTNANEYVTYVKISAPNYATIWTNAIVKINPKEVTLTSGAYEGEYDAKAHSNATVTASGFLAGEGVTTNTWVTITDVGTNANEFTYEVLDGTLASNYRVTCVTNDLVVTKRKFPGDERELYIDATNFTYTAYGQGPQVTNDFITVDGVDFPTNLFDFVESYKTNVDEYVLQIVPKNPENFEGIIEVPWNITKAPLTVTPKPMARTYLDPKPGQGDYLGWTAATLLGEDTEACLTGTPVYDTDYAAGSPVGDYDITVTGLESANYEITFAKGVLTVVDAEPTIPEEEGDPSIGPRHTPPTEVPPAPAEGFVISTNDYVGVYDGEAHTILTNQIWEAIRENPFYAGNNPNVTFSLDGSSWGPDPFFYTNVVSTSFWYCITADNCQPYYHAAGVTITPRHVTLKSGSTSKYLPEEGGYVAASNDMVWVVGETNFVVNSGVQDWFKASFSTNLYNNVPDGPVANAFTAVVEPGLAENYVFTYVYGELQIKTKPDKNTEIVEDVPDKTGKGVIRIVMDNTEAGEWAADMPDQLREVARQYGQLPGEEIEIRLKINETSAWTDSNWDFYTQVTNEIVKSARDDAVPEDVIERYRYNAFDITLTHIRTTETSSSTNNIGHVNEVALRIVIPYTLKDNLLDFSIWRNHSWTNEAGTVLNKIEELGYGSPETESDASYTTNQVGIVFVMKKFSELVTKELYAMQPLLTGSLTWKYHAAQNCFYAGLTVACTNGNNAAISNLCYIYEDRADYYLRQLRNSNKLSAVSSWEKDPNFAKVPLTDVEAVLRAGTALPVSANYGVSASTLANGRAVVPSAEQKIALVGYNGLMLDTTGSSANETLGYLVWQEAGQPTVYSCALGADAAPLNALLLSAPSPMPLTLKQANLSLTLGALVTDDSDPTLRVAEFDVGPETICGRIESVVDGQTGTPSARARLTVLGAAEPAGEYKEIARPALSAGGSFEMAKPEGVNFFKTRLEAMDIVK